MDTKELFQLVENTHDKGIYGRKLFELIPEAERLNPDRQLCGLLYLQKLGCTNPIIGADHDNIWVETPDNPLTEEQVRYLLRCGVHYSTDGECLAIGA